MQLDALKNMVLDVLEELKAMDVRILDVSQIAGFTDLMIIATGTSSRQIRALSDKIIEKCKENGVRSLGVEGEQEANWVLVDLGDIVVHVMNPETRTFYNLEKLWSVKENGSTSAAS